MNTYLKEFIKKNFKIPGKALDLGAGKFDDVNSLMKQGWQCEGVDLRTGVDLEKPYFSKIRPFDLVFSNYVLHKLNNKNEFTETCYNNLARNGLLFIVTFDKKDKVTKGKGFTREELNALFCKFKNIIITEEILHDKEHDHNLMILSGQK